MYYLESFSSLIQLHLFKPKEIKTNEANHIPISRLIYFNGITQTFRDKKNQISSLNAFIYNPIGQLLLLVKQ
ncbi:MAG: hypothetical protein ACI9N1_001947 [Flavobacteriales bacterium]